MGGAAAVKNKSAPRLTAAARLDGGDVLMIVIVSNDVC